MKRQDYADRAKGIDKNAQRLPAIFGRRQQMAAIGASMAYHPDPDEAQYSDITAIKKTPRLRETKNKYMQRPQAFPYDPDLHRNIDWGAHAASIVFTGALAPSKKNIVVIPASRPGKRKEAIAIVAYPGTNPKDLKDIFTDLNAVQHPVPIRAIQPKYAAGRGRDLHVHRGFADRYVASRPVLERALTRYRQMNDGEDPSEIVFAGHSLGGALAQLAALDFQKRGLRYPISSTETRPVKITSYVIESPPIGQEGLLDLWDNKDHYNYLHYDSPIAGWAINNAAKMLKGAALVERLRIDKEKLDKRLLYDASKRVELKKTAQQQRGLSTATADVFKTGAKAAARMTLSAVKIADKVRGEGGWVTKSVGFAERLMGDSEGPPEPNPETGQEIAATPVVPKNKTGEAVFAFVGSIAGYGQRRFDLHDLDKVVENFPASGREAGKRVPRERDDPAPSARWSATITYYTSNESTSSDSVTGQLRAPAALAIEDRERPLALEGPPQPLLLEGPRQRLLLEGAPARGSSGQGTSAESRGLLRVGRTDTGAVRPTRSSPGPARLDRTAASKRQHPDPDHKGKGASKSKKSKGNDRMLFMENIKEEDDPFAAGPSRQPGGQRRVGHRAADCLPMKPSRRRTRPVI